MTMIQYIDNVIDELIKFTIIKRLMSTFPKMKQNKMTQQNNDHWRSVPKEKKRWIKCEIPIV